ncbi:MAG: hypothetical protein UU93_C0022G0009 [Candidatus Amesbacteria bacterium GW2011_GWA2_42_12]|uniref:Uncharacterized protein n=1 Tax=Candidatus Amesbacteria bacterium GW2011_GWA2_42_12 TaxID=1618356 RepID=A0A0G1B0T5_9BACT|nr:MAG: hypothetical protein UU93_C0022G0009 [Candidatus Amesbacteria bacterium GW2011_GWA2_42_12]
MYIESNLRGEQRNYQSPALMVRGHEQPSPLTTEQSLNNLFPEQQFFDKRIKQAKDVLGLLAFEFSESELNNLILEVESLTESWLDEFERQTFNGLTLQELLHEKGAK